MKEQITVYEPNQKAKSGFFSCWIFMVQNIIRSRELIWQLFKRDFMANYKQSFLGIVWIILTPLAGIISWVFMNSTGLLNPGDVGVPYPVYVLVGSTIWALFIGFYTSTASSISAGSSLILHVNFSREALIAQQIAQTVANFMLSLLMTLVVFFVFGIVPSWKSIFFPLTLIPIFFIGAGIGMIVAVISVVAHDINKIVTVSLGFLMFLTPVIYAPKFQNKIVQIVLKWNPMSYLISTPRDVIFYGQIENPTGYFYSTLFSIVIFLLSWRFFFLSEHKVAEKL